MYTDADGLTFLSSVLGDVLVWAYNYGAYLGADKGSAIISGGAAAEAGLRDGDIILEVNGIKIGKAGSLSTLIGEYKVGEEVILKVARSGSESEIKVKLKAYKS